MKKLKCDGEKDCSCKVTHIDHKGFIYCANHGDWRALYERCRKLTKKELAQLKEGKPLERY